MKANQAKSALGRRNISVALILCLVVFGVLIVMGILVPGQGSRGDSKVRLSVEDPRPVAKAIEILEARYGFVITYEDPRYTHASELTDVTEKVRRDLAKFKPGEAPRVLIPKGGVLAFEYEVATVTNQPSDPATIVRQLIDAHAATGNAGKFRLERSGQIIHVIPTAIKNSEGKLASQESLLDVMVTVPAEDRTAARTLQAICAAISQATHMRVVVGTLPFSVFLNHRDQEGVANERARDALVHLFGRAADGINLSWQLLYDPGMKIYALNIHQVPTAKTGA